MSDFGLIGVSTRRPPQAGGGGGGGGTVAYETSAQTVSASAGGSTTVMTVPVPTGLSSGDFWIAGIFVDTDPGATITGPSGWTAITTQKSGGEGWPTARFYYKVAGASETTTTAQCTTGYKGVVHALRLSGASSIGNVSTFIDDGGDSSNPTATLTIPTITISANNSVAIAFYAMEGEPSGSAATITQASTMTMAQVTDTGENDFPMGATAYAAKNSGSYSAGDWTIDRTTASDLLDGICVIFEVNP